MRALFDYEPNDDTLLPCKEIGLPFQNGDILQVNISAFSEISDVNNKLTRISFMYLQDNQRQRSELVAGEACRH